LDWRRLASYLLLFGTFFVAVDLFLLGHYEDPWQWTPLALLAIGLGVGTWTLRAPSPGSVRALRVVSGAYVIAAGIGIYLHVASNVEFELELRPGAGGADLLWDSLTGGMPALAPGAMAQLGLLGLLITYRHPSLNPAGSTTESV
jgi:hypothetical protein